MPASSADIAAGTREATIVRYADNALHTTYPSARDGAAEPAEGYFDTAADALTAVTQRGAILARTRRFAVEVADLLWLDPTTGTPTVQLTDAEYLVDMLMGCARIEIDLENEVTRLELF